MFGLMYKINNDRKKETKNKKIILKIAMIKRAIRKYEAKQNKKE